VNEVVVTAIGADRPGIVAALSAALLDIGGNLEDGRAALLRGSFAITLAVAVPEGVEPEMVAARLAPVADELGLGISVQRADPKADAPTGRRCMVSIYGADRPGIVAVMAAALAENRVNILDLSARLVGDPAIYVLGMEVEIPDDSEPAAIAGALRQVAATRGLEVSFEIEESEAL
jgi:glycine cleavage system transcriptional repressor